MSQTLIRDQIPTEELMTSGHLACPGCGAPIAMRLVLKALGPRTVIVMPACCWTIIAGPWPQSSVEVPVYHSPFAGAPAVASGVRAALDARGDTDTSVVVWAGDGGTFDIGIQALSGAAERNENIIYFCYDNEAYMNTGIQRSSSTPVGAWTTTTPAGRAGPMPKKDILSILTAHGIPYAATASIAYPLDLLAKVRKAKSLRGTRFLHILSPCPPGWRADDGNTVELARIAVCSRAFPLLEVENGRWRFTQEHPGDCIEPYIKMQGRFRTLSEEQQAIVKQQIAARWEELEQRVAWTEQKDAEGEPENSELPG